MSAWLRRIFPSFCRYKHPPSKKQRIQERSDRTEAPQRKKYTSFENKPDNKNLNKREIFTKRGEERISKKCSHLKNKKAAFLSEMPHFFEWACLSGIVLRTEEKIKSYAKRGARSKNACFSEKYRFLRRRPAIFFKLTRFSEV